MKNPPQLFPDRASTEGAFARHVSRGKVETYRGLGLDVVMGAREGIRFWDGFEPRRSWINCHCNGGVFNLGHRHPRVLQAMRTALEHLDLGNHHLVSGYRAELAWRLSQTTRDRLPGAVFAASGGEAVDLAIKLVRGASGRSGIVSASGGYHGHTGLAMAAGDAAYRRPFGADLPGFAQVPFNDLAALERAVGDDTAAVLLETIPATLGMLLPDDGYLERVRALCKARGARLILDEVQSGLGRTGRLWAWQHHDVEPDIVITGKGLSGGLYPMAATLMTAELHSFFDKNPFIHLSTFGGAELGCAVALAVLDIVEAPGFLERVSTLSDRLAEGFRGLPFAVRRRGLMMALKFPVEAGGLLAAKMLFEAGIFAVYANHDISALQFLPPLVLSDAECDEIVSIVRKVFS